MAIQGAFNFKKWIDEHRHLLKPPVGNQVVYRDTEFIIMVVGGPNSRKDYHYNEGEEFFYQLEGDIVVKIQEDGKPRDIEIKEGDIFLLPPRVPHSPQRTAGSIGLVIERERNPDELDAFMWFCENCNNKVYEKFLPLKNIVTDLPKVFEEYYGNQENCTCDKCGTVMHPPPAVK